MPPFRLEASAGGRNLVHSLLQTAGMDFQSLQLSASTLDAQPFRADLLVNRLHTGSLTLDTLRLGLARRDRQLGYWVRLSNRPGNLEQMALIAAAGQVEEDRATVQVYQRSRSDSVGFRFGLNAQWQDSAIRATLTPERPVFGYLPWQVNADNFIEYHFNRQLEADLRLEGPEAGQHVYLTSAPLEPSLPTGAVKLDMAGIDIGTALEMLPSSPPIDGTLATDVSFGFYEGRIAAAGKVGVTDLSYQDRRVGNIGLDVDFQSDSLNRYTLKAGMQVDQRTVLTAEGSLPSNEQENLTVQASLQSFPLTVLNAFLPEETVQWERALNGSLAVGGTTLHPVANGNLQFVEGRLSVPLIGTAFGLEAGAIEIADSRLDLGRISLVSPNNQRLTIDGTVNFADLSRLVVDVTAQAQNFELISSTSNDRSQIYGKAPIDVDLTARGATDALTVRGDVRLLRGTDVTYTLPEQTARVQSVKQDLVSFVDFDDPATLVPDTTRRLDLFGLDMLVNIDIQENIEVTVNLSDDGNNRAEVAGHGNLTYTLNTQGDSRFMGRFDVASGRILYSPPVISQKDFAIEENSYVEWTGDMLNPTFDITAIQNTSVNVDFNDGESSQNVNFQIMILVRNSLENIDLSFDLAAPNNAAISDELAQMSPEQRMQQAFSLLAYNRYTGPSATRSANVNDPLNTFITRELNTWTRDNLQGIDLSLGLNTVDGEDGTHTNYSYQVSKSFMDDRIKVTVGGNVDPEATGEENLQNNFVQNVSVEYRLTERDNMYLRFFRNLTQESMLDSEVIETGVGFLLRKRLNRLGDLFKLMPKEQRRERRQIRREMRDADDREPDPARQQRQQPALEDPNEPTV
ncbi:MAG: translocation/assembly module TamB [Rikenellaceae bacterium]|nr:translocation/assembly module TamB [Rikenellaceae bacterium]